MILIESPTMCLLTVRKSENTVPRILRLLYRKHVPHKKMEGKFRLPGIRDNVTVIICEIETCVTVDWGRRFMVPQFNYNSLDHHEVNLIDDYVSLSDCRPRDD